MSFWDSLIWREFPRENSFVFVLFWGCFFFWGGGVFLLLFCFGFVWMIFLCFVFLSFLASLYETDVWRVGDGSSVDQSDLFMLRCEKSVDHYPLPWSKHTSDMKGSALAATLPGTWCCRVSTRTGWAGCQYTVNG